MPQIQEWNYQIAEDEPERYHDFFVAKEFIVKKCVEVGQVSQQDSTPTGTLISSFCTFLLRYQSVPPNKISVFGELSKEPFSADTNIVQVKVETSPAKVGWLGFCESLFPGARGYTKEESEAYSGFINSFFEIVEI